MEIFQIQTIQCSTGVQLNFVQWLLCFDMIAFCASRFGYSIADVLCVNMITDYIVELIFPVLQFFENIGDKLMKTQSVAVFRWFHIKAELHFIASKQ